MRDKDYEQRIKVVPERLKQILDETFRGNMRLMAFCCDTDKNILKSWLEGKRLPQSVGLMPYVIGIDPWWVEGRTDKKEITDVALMPKSDYRQCYTYGESEIWLMRELVKINALRMTEHKKYNRRTAR